MWRGSGGAGTFLSRSVSAVVVMVSSTKAVVVVVAIAVLAVALLPESTTSMPQKSKRRKFSPYPLRKSYDNFPLKGFLPHRVPCCWYGYDAEGYSRNGRDVSKLMPQIEETPTM